LDQFGLFFDFRVSLYADAFGFMACPGVDFARELPLFRQSAYL
jgi:hypothetical protein